MILQLSPVSDPKERGLCAAILLANPVRPVDLGYGVGVPAVTQSESMERQHMFVMLGMGLGAEPTPAMSS